ncbi:oligopeptide/dipeptide ABC transporter ATP-binding protein [Paenibacillus lautus]|jgi:peptide/nickel transport system ATP-binding protein|uniref:oligopeptide/dipeptide ABC transporter ATP-binding protein n=1 Tax=Paenibacillus lautus TaxID=1401 RepID=UPI002DBFE18C|nr:oligopeptide/dipeptide ABC transporter ATP-binding protein [Paenibacillus lautus]MEC0258645.1 hypothetical protein [Paenibacillus lautus]
MYAGVIVEEAATAELLALPRHPYTRGLLRTVATVVTVRGSWLHSIEGSIPNLAALPDGCRFHPRCPFASERCMQETSSMSGDERRRTACWHSEELVQRKDWLAEAAEVVSKVVSEAVPRGAMEAIRGDEGLGVEMDTNLNLNRRDDSLAGEPDVLFAVEHLRKYHPVLGRGFGGKKLITALQWCRRTKTWSY